MIIIIPGRPVAKARPRFARRGKFVVTYNDQQTEEGKVLWHIQQQWLRPPMTGVVIVDLCFHMPRPKGHFGTGKNAGIVRGSAPAFPIVKPDIDNLIKFYLDCMNGVVFEDDRQIIRCHASKLYSEALGVTEIRFHNA